MKELTFIDLFAGAGGFGLGFQMAGIKPILSLEMDKSACETLKLNNNHNVLHADITKVSTRSKITKSLNNVAPNIIIGGPPCQGFSVAAANRVVKYDSRNSMFEYFLQWVKVLNPEGFVLENVPQFKSKKNVEGNYVLEVLKKQAKKLDYTISTWSINAADYGVPQSRNRIFIVGLKGQQTIKPPAKTHSEEPKFKSHRHYVTVGDAILDLPIILAREGSEEMEYENGIYLTAYQKWARRKSNSIYNHVAMNHTKRVVNRYLSIMDGIVNLPLDQRVRKRNGNGELSTSPFNMNYRHLKEDMVSFTIPASFYSSFIHPTLPRNITAREAARLQSFPDYYHFKGKRTLVSKSLLRSQGKESEISLSQYNQIGNAVPPLLAKCVAKKVKEAIL